VARGGVAIFTASAQDSARRFLADVRFEWQMLDPLAGSISTGGVFSASDIPGVYPDAIEVVAIQQTERETFTATSTATVIITSGFIDTSIASVAVFPSRTTARVGERVLLRAAAIGDRGGLVQDIELFWTLADGALGSIDNNGGLTIGDQPGDYPNAVQVLARRLGGDDTVVVGTASVTVLSQEAAAQEVRARIGPTSVIGAVGLRMPLIFLAFDFQGRPVHLENIQWDVLDPAVGDVDARGRMVLGSVPGTYPASIRATGDVDGQGLSVSAFLDVIVQPPADVLGRTPGTPQIIPASTRLRDGQRVRLSAFYFDADGLPITDEDVHWESDPSVVTVDGSGRVVAVGLPGVYRDAVWAVVPSPDGGTQILNTTIIIEGDLARVDVIPGRAFLEAGILVQFSALAFDSADNRLFGVSFVRELAAGTPGTLTRGGIYAAGDVPGSYEGSVLVTATQRVRR